jgi:hypothetical protein
MAVLIDTRNVAAEDREESLHEAFSQAAVPRHISLSAEAVGSTRIDGWMFGSTKLFCPASPGLEVIRTPTQGRLEPIIALCLQDRGTGRFRQDGQQWNLMPGQVIMAGPTSPNEFLITGATSAFELPFEEIGLPFETVRKASGQLAASPLLPLVTGYLVSLRRDAGSVSSVAPMACRRGSCNGIHDDITTTSSSYARWDQNCARTECSALAESRVSIRRHGPRPGLEDHPLLVPGRPQGPHHPA